MIWFVVAEDVFLLASDFWTLVQFRLYAPCCYWGMGLLLQALLCMLVWFHMKSESSSRWAQSIIVSRLMQIYLNRKMKMRTFLLVSCCFQHFSLPFLNLRTYWIYTYDRRDHKSAHFRETVH